MCSPSCVRGSWVVLTGVLALAATARAEPAGDDQARASAAIGGLHRAAAGVEAALTLYGHALTELQVAAARVAAEGEAKVTPRAAIPDPVTEVFRRLSATLPDRVPSAALPVLARSYHGEVVDALERLALANELGEVVGPLGDLARGMAGVSAAADLLGDLFSRRRPIQMQLVDPELMLEDVANALDQVMSAEQRIGELRGRGAPAGDQFQAVRALEVALGHALDLIALAEQAGLHIGFEVQLGAEALAASAARVRRGLAGLDAVLAELRRPPGALAGQLRAWGLGRVDQVEMALRWTPDPASGAAAVRIYRRTAGEVARARLVEALRCEGKSEAAAVGLADSALAGQTDAELLVAELAPGRASFAELIAAPIAPPEYRVVPVNSFAVEGESLRATAVVPPALISGPTMIAARALAPALDDPAFYTDHDAVEVTWQLSPNDERAILALGPAGAALRAISVVGYRVLRLNARGDQLTVGRVASGTDRFVDRVPLDRLADGVRYSVEAVGVDGRGVRPPEGCAESAPVQLDLRPALTLARWGVPSIRQPAAAVRARAAALPADEGWARLSVEERQAVTTAWWGAQSSARRQALLARWPALAGASEAEVPAAPPAVLLERDRVRAIIEAWLADQPAEVQAEVDRWWGLLPARAQRQAVDAWRKAASPEVVAAAGSEPGAARGVRLGAWWMSRDAESVAQLVAWWESLPVEERERRLARWYGALTAAEQRAVHWPAWSTLDAEERRARLASPPPLPPSLQAEALAYRAWSAVLARADAAAEAEVRAAVALPARWRAALAYGLRPLDLALSFRLRPLAAFAAVLVAAVGLAAWARRRELNAG